MIDLSANELTRLLRKRMNLSEVRVVWFSVFGTGLDDDFPGHGLDESVIELWLRAEKRKLIKRLFEELAKEREDLAADVAALRRNERPPSLKFINVPARNEFFTGRDDILSKLHAALCANGRAAIKQAISGLGGIGKTQTAIEYAHRYVSEYVWILWTSAESEEALSSGFAAFGPELGVPTSQEQSETVKAVKRWLASNSGWLLILDNADEPNVMKNFFSSQFLGKALLTSRASHFDALGNFEPIVLDVMTPPEGLEFLKERTKRTTLLADEERAAHALAKELGYLPLALEQAGAYVSATKTPFSVYLGLFRERRLKMLERKKPIAGEYAKTVATTWQLNFEEAERKSPAAADILRVSAFFWPEVIPVELIGAGAPCIFADVEAVMREFATVNEALEPLMQYSLIRMNESGDAYDVHRLVQAVIQDAMSEEARRSWAERAVRAVNASFPFVEFESWEKCDRMFVHVKASEGWMEKYGFEFEEAGLLLNQAGYFLNVRGRYREAEPLLERALAIYEKALGEEHPAIATSANNLALLYSAQGEYAKALPLYERGLAICEKALGEEHSDTANSLNNLAGLYARNGEYAKALPLFERGLAIFEKTLGEEHPSTATSVNNLAGLYELQGDYAKASPLYERGLAIFEKALGEEHPDTANSLNNLAGLYYAQGEYAKALPLFERGLAIAEKTLGKDHPDTATSVNNLAGLYYAQGEYTKALPLFERGLTSVEKALGKEHPDTVTNVNNLALLYSAQGEYAKALPLYERVMAILEKTLGKDHSNTKIFAESVAAVCKKLNAKK